MIVPFSDLRPSHDQIRPEIDEAIRSVIDHSHFILGDQVTAFEQAYAAFSGTRFAIGVGNGLDALILILKALNIGPGDEVIVPSNTYIATWIAVTAVGADIVPVEPDIYSYNIDPSGIEQAISSKTKAIIPVHLYGRLADMPTIMDIALKHNIYVVEDNAQAQGAVLNGKRSGSFGIANATSFYPSKNLGCLGDGGAVTTNDEEIYHKICALRNYGSQKKYYNDVLGFNSRLDEMQASILNVKLSKLTVWNENRKSIAEKYQYSLSEIKQIVLPVEVDSPAMVNHIYQIRIPDRDKLQAFLRNESVQTMIHYPVPPHAQNAYKYLGFKPGSFPVAEEIAATCLSLPLYPLMDEEKINYVCGRIKSFFYSFPK